MKIFNKCNTSRTVSLLLIIVLSLWICLSLLQHPDQKNISTNELRNKIRQTILAMDPYDEQAASQLIYYYLDPPTKDIYYLKEVMKDQDDLKYRFYKSIYPSWIFIDSVVRDLFNGSKKGFFVEAGALDGEFLSNTLSLEMNFGWTGLLVESNHVSYREMKRKNRKAWKAQLCLTGAEKPTEVLFSSNCFFEQLPFSERGSNKNTKLAEFDANTCVDKAFCVPTSTLLRALNITRVNFFSLDIEDMEMEILKSFPFDDIQVDVWVIEHVFWNNTEVIENDPEADIFQDDQFVIFMESKGYYLFDLCCNLISDYVFVRRNTDIFKKLKVPEKFWKRRKVCNGKSVVNELIPNTPAHLRDPRHYPNIEFKEI